MDKDVNELHNELLNNISDTYQKSEGFPIWDLLRSFAYGLKSLWDKANHIESLLNVDNLTGEDLERFVGQRKSVTRKTATKSVGQIKIVSGNGTVTEGDIFSTKGGVEFVATETKTVSEGVFVAVEAVVAGVLGNVPAESIVEMPVTIPGINAVTNPNVTTDGFDEETDDSLRNRYYEELRLPATSGNVYHYRKWAKEVSGVGDAKVFSLWDGDNTVQIVIINDKGEPANSELVSRVQNYIDPDISGTGEGEAPIGAYCTVTSASALEINITGDLTILSSYNSQIVINAIKSSVSEYCKSIGFNSDYVSVAKIGDIILNTEGVEDYSNLKVNNSIIKLSIPEKSIPILKGVNFNVE